MVVKMQAWEFKRSVVLLCAQHPLHVPHWQQDLWCRWLGRLESVEDSSEGLRINCFEVQTPSPLYSGKSPAAWQQNWVCIHRPSQRHKDLSPPPIHHPGTAIYFKSRQNYALYLLVWVNRVAQGNS